MAPRITPPIVACVADSARARLLKALPQIVFHASVASIERDMRAHDDCLIVVDPQAIPDGDQTILRWRDHYPRLSIVLYLALEPEAMQLAVRLAQSGISEVVFRSYDDSPERMRHLVEECQAVTAQQLAPIEPALARLPSCLSRAVRELFRRPRRFRCTLDLAASAGMSARGTFRHLKVAGFVSPRRLVAGAKVIRAHRLLAGGARSGNEVAARLGYRSVDQLSQHLGELAGCTASDLKRGDVPPDFEQNVLRSLLARPERRPSREAFAYAN